MSVGGPAVLQRDLQRVSGIPWLPRGVVGQLDEAIDLLPIDASRLLEPDSEYPLGRLVVEDYLARRVHEDDRDGQVADPLTREDHLHGLLGHRSLRGRGENHVRGGDANHKGNGPTAEERSVSSDPVHPRPAAWLSDRLSPTRTRTRPPSAADPLVTERRRAGRRAGRMGTCEGGVPPSRALPGTDRPIVPWRHANVKPAALRSTHAGAIPSCSRS